MTTLATPDPAPSCVACGAPLQGPWCARCGQRVLDHRHTVRGFAAGAIGRLFNLERGFLHTVARLTVAPAQVVRDYLRGRTNPYTHPFAYLLVAFAAFALTARGLGGATGGDADRVFTGLIVFFLAGAGRLVFLRAGLNYAEHLIAALYLFGHAVVLLTVGQVVVYLLPDAAMTPVAIPWLAATGLYLVWAYASLFPRRPILAAASALLTLALGLFSWAATLALLLHAWRTAQG